MDLLDLFAKIGIDTTEYEDGINKASGMAGKVGNALKTGMKVGAAAVTAVTGATIALTKGLVDGASEVAQFGDQIDKASQKLGLSTDAYQEWDAVLQHSGTSIDALTAPMRNLTNLAEKGSDAFTELGLSEEQVASMNREELFAATIEGLQNITDEGERSRLATELLGRGAMELSALLNTTAEDTQAMKDRVHELGGVMSEDSIKASAAFQDSLQDLQTSFGSLKRGLTADFMPGLTTVMNGLTEIFSGDPDSGVAMISEGVDGILSGLNDRLPIFLDTGVAIIEALLNAFIENLPKILEMGGKLVGQLIAGLIKNIPALIRSIPEIIKAIVSGLVSAWPEIKQAGIDLVTVIGEGLKSALDAALGWGKDLIDNFVSGITGKWNDLKGAVSNVAGTVKDFLGFSEPKEGPLSNFHTFAPDMMKLFIEGIDKGKRSLEQELSSISAITAGTFSVDTQSTQAQRGSYGASAVSQPPIVLNIEMTNELDGAITSRKLFRYLIDEGDRRGTPITLGGNA